MLTRLSCSVLDTTNALDAFESAAAWVKRTGRRSLALSGSTFRDRAAAMDIEEVVIAPHSPWRNPCAERVIGAVRRECLDHVVVLGEVHLRRIVGRYVRYYHGTRTDLALEKDAPVPRSVQPPDRGAVIEIPEVGGLHYHYKRRAT